MRNNNWREERMVCLIENPDFFDNRGITKEVVRMAIMQLGLPTMAFSEMRKRAHKIRELLPAMKTKKGFINLTWLPLLAHGRTENRAIIGNCSI